MMYWNGNGDLGWGAWLAMSVGMMVFWGFVIWGVVTLVRGGGTRSEVPREPDPERILAERFARGEIDVDEYQARLSALRGGGAPTPSGK